MPFGISHFLTKRFWLKWKENISVDRKFHALSICNRRFVFQSRSSPSKLSFSENNWKNTNSEILQIPSSNSPDLNVVEELWNIIDKRLASKPVNNKAELEKRVQEEWDKISITLCQSSAELEPVWLFRTGPDRPVWLFRPDRTGRLPAGSDSWLNRQKNGKKPAGHNPWFYRCKTGAFHASFKQLVLSENTFLIQIDEDIYCQSHNSWTL